MTLRPQGKPFRVTFGDRGEMIAWNYLLKHGYKILEKNYRCKLGEIDVVAEKAKRLHFIEVKTRTHHGFGRPEESVHRFKQRKLVSLAQWYLKEKRQSNHPVCFDVLAITLNLSKEPEIQLIENAFSADDHLM